MQLKILPAPEQSTILLDTMARFNAAATYAAEVAYTDKVFSQPSIHGRCYAEIRKRYGLSAQMAVRAIGKAVEAFNRDKSICPIFRPLGAITYDQRILSFKGLDKVSLWTMTGRMLLPLAYGEYQGERFDRMKGQVDLVYRDGQFYLYATVDMPDGTRVDPTDWLGVDLGIVQIATDSDGNSYSGSAVEKCRLRHHKNRKRLQGKGTKGAKKRLKKLAGREARFRRHENHCISKAIVVTAKDTNRGIALEELTHIRDRITVRRKQRAKHSGWAFAQLRSFVEYKAKLAGITVLAVDPRNTSRTCCQCGHCEKANRKSQAEFECRQCGHTANADANAALNLRMRAWDAIKQSPELVSRAA